LLTSSLIDFPLSGGGTPRANDPISLATFDMNYEEDGPDSQKNIEALKKADFLVVGEINPGETSKFWMSPGITRDEMKQIPTTVYLSRSHRSSKFALRLYTAPPLPSRNSRNAWRLICTARVLRPFSLISQNFVPFLCLNPSALVVRHGWKCLPYSGRYPFRIHWDKPRL
jgi:hypothetical protein